MFVVWPTPYRATRPRILPLYNLGDGKPRGILLVVTSCRNLCHSHSQNFLCVVQSLLLAELRNYFTVVLNHISPRATTSAFIVTYINSLNKSTISTSKESWLVSWISILKHPARGKYQLPSGTSRSVNTGVPTSNHLLGIQHVGRKILVSAFGVWVQSTSQLHQPNCHHIIHHGYFWRLHRSRPSLQCATLGHDLHYL
jgi:hypothetical protein